MKPEKRTPKFSEAQLVIFNFAFASEMTVDTCDWRSALPYNRHALQRTSFAFSISCTQETVCIAYKWVYSGLMNNRRTPRKSCTFRVPDSSDSDNESAAGSSSDSDSFIWQSDAELLRLPPYEHIGSRVFVLSNFYGRKPKRPEQSPEELRYIEDAIASIRLRVNHHDPYEDWEKETKKEAFVCIRSTLSFLGLCLTIANRSS